MEEEEVATGMVLVCIQQLLVAALRVERVVMERVVMVTVWLTCGLHQQLTLHTVTQT